jgi:hypothetical protein
MSLLLTGAKTIQIAGTPMSCIEIYTGESYTIPFAFTDSVGDPIDISSWTLTTAAKWYTCVTDYPNNSTTTIDISDLTLLSPQPSQPSGLTAAKTSGGTGGLGYLFIPTTLSGGTGSPNPSPVLTVDDPLTQLCIITMTITRTDAVSGSTDTNREPIGIIIRYQ